MKNELSKDHNSAPLRLSPPVAILPVMRLLIAIFAVLFSLTLPAFALTQEEAKDIALGIASGRITASDHKVAGDVALYEFEIEQKDQTLIALEIDAATGALLRTQVKFAEGAALPKAEITEDQAWSVALRHIDAVVAGQGDVERGKSAMLSLLNGVLVYELRVRKVHKGFSSGAREYDVYVNAKSGAPVSFREDD